MPQIVLEISDRNMEYFQWGMDQNFVKIIDPVALLQQLLEGDVNNLLFFAIEHGDILRQYHQETKGITWEETEPKAI